VRSLDQLQELEIQHGPRGQKGSRQRGNDHGRRCGFHPVGNSTRKTFGKVIQHFIYSGDETCMQACDNEVTEGRLVARIGRSTSARIRTLVCQSRFTGLDQSLASLVL
jgi:hypothetical protein